MIQYAEVRIDSREDSPPISRSVRVPTNALSHQGQISVQITCTPSGAGSLFVISIPIEPRSCPTPFRIRRTDIGGLGIEFGEAVRRMSVRVRMAARFRTIFEFEFGFPFHRGVETILANRIYTLVSSFP